MGIIKEKTPLILDTSKSSRIFLNREKEPANEQKTQKFLYRKAKQKKNPQKLKLHLFSNECKKNILQDKNDTATPHCFLLINDNLGSEFYELPILLFFKKQKVNEGETIFSLYVRQS